MARTVAAAGALLGALALTAVRVHADPAVCGGQGLPNCPLVSYVTPEYVLPGQPTTVTLEGTDTQGITGATLVPGGQAVPVHHLGSGGLGVDVPGLPPGNYFFQLDLPGGPVPLVDGGGIVVDPSGGPTGPRAPRPDTSPAAVAAAPTPAPGSTPTPTAAVPSATPAPVSAAAVAAPATPAPVSAAAVTARLPEHDDTTGTLLRIAVGVTLACGAVEAVNVLNRRRAGRPGRRFARTPQLALDAAVVAGGKANRFCASCGTGGAALVRWRFENGAGVRVPLCRRCR